MGILYNFLRVFIVFLQGFLVYNGYRNKNYISMICWLIVLIIFLMSFVRDFKIDRRNKEKRQR